MDFEQLKTLNHGLFKRCINKKIHKMDKQIPSDSLLRYGPVVERQR